MRVTGYPVDKSKSFIFSVSVIYVNTVVCLVYIRHNKESRPTRCLFNNQLGSASGCNYRLDSFSYLNPRYFDK